jgi:ABC-2 type transport system ATP-binding protein
MAISTEPRPAITPPSIAELPVEPPMEQPTAAARPWADGTTALLVDHVTKRFSLGRKKPTVVAVDDVSLRVERGEVYGILGANGGGKSTLIRLVSTLLTLDTGRVEVFGHDVERDEMAVKRLINRVSVDAAFFKKLSPHENLLYAARLYGLRAGEARQEAERILGRLGIAKSRLGSPLEQMSRGMQQKVAIARAILTSPTLLLLDEPTTGLDPRSKLDVQAFIEEIKATHDATILLTTHDLAEADRLCDRLSILDRGRLVVEGTPDALKLRVAAEYGQPATLDSVFMTWTGRSLDDDVEDEEPNDVPPLPTPQPAMSTDSAATAVPPDMADVPPTRAAADRADP